MELWNECLANENLTTEIKFRLIVANTRRVNLIYSLVFTLDIVCGTIFRNHCRPKKMFAASIKRLANLIISQFQSIRIEGSFESFYNVVLKKMKELLFTSEPKLPRKRLAPDYFVINDFSSSSNKQGDAYCPNTT